ncbi:MAG: methyltransferase [Desulfobacterales bacterium]
MKPANTDDVLDLMDASFTSAALGTALELGLFWLLESRPLDAKSVALELGIPPLRCYYWLQLLCRTGLIEESSHGYKSSSTARTAILEAYSQDSWALLAEEARGRLPGLCDLPIHIRESGSAWNALGLSRPTYVDRLLEEPERARRFTRMLYELHQPLADELAGLLDMSGVKRLMDLGGGSGVISIEFVRRNPKLTAVVVDIPNVCVAGIEIAAENALEDRIIYHPANFLHDDLPLGFDMVLECDVDVYSETLFRKVKTALNPGGRFVIVDQFAPEEGVAPPSRLHWAFEGSMMSPEFMFPTKAQILEQLKNAGFQLLPEKSLPLESASCTRFTNGLVVIEAQK